MNIEKIINDWCNPVLVKDRKPTVEEACETIMSLAGEIKRKNTVIEFERNRQNIKEQHYKTMMNELHNVISTYT